MRGYEKQPVICKEKNALVSVGLGKATRMKNCVYKEGVLCIEGGTTPFMLAEQAVYIPSNLPTPHQFFRIPQGDGFGYLSKNGWFMRYDTSENSFVGVHNFNVEMRAVCAFDEKGTERLLVIGSAGVYEYGEQTGVTLVLQPTETASPVACVCKDRVFFLVKPYTLFYSAPLEPLRYAVTAEESGRIDFPYDKGEIVAIAPHGDGLAIFYEYGVATLKTDGSARDFVWKSVAYGGGRILKNSAGNAGVGGEKTFFLADDGVYALDKNSVKKVCENMSIKPKWTGQVCEHAESGGKYYAVYETENGEREGIVVDTQAETGCFSFASYGLSVCGGVAVCMAGGRLLSAMGGDSLPSGEYAEADYKQLAFLTAHRKTLRTVKAYGEGVLHLEIVRGDKRKRYAFDLSNGEAMARVCMRGDRFSLRCKMENGTRLYAIVAECTALQSVRVEKERGRRTYGN